MILPILPTAAFAVAPSVHAVAVAAALGSPWHSWWAGYVASLLHSGLDRLWAAAVVASVAAPLVVVVPLGGLEDSEVVGVPPSNHSIPSRGFSVS